MNEFLTTLYLPLLIIHVFGTIVGMGGATIADILFFNFFRDYHMTQKEIHVLHILGKLIMAALFVIILSGIGLYIPKQAELLASPLFLLKATAVGVITLNGIALHLWVAPHLVKISFLHRKSVSRPHRRLAFALGAVSFISWYTVFLVAMLRPSMPAVPYSILVGIYAFLLFTGMTGSQVAEAVMHRLASRRHSHL